MRVWCCDCLMYAGKAKRKAWGKERKQEKNFYHTTIPHEKHIENTKMEGNRAKKEKGRIGAN